MIDFVEQPPWASVAERVMVMIKAGDRHEAIAAQIPCPYSWVAKAQAWWHHQQGLPVPDGRSMRSRLGKQSEAEALSEPAKVLWDQDFLIQEIARC